MKLFSTQPTVVFIAVALCSSLLLSGCAPGAQPGVTPTAYSDILVQKLPSDVTAKGVLVAAILLSTADIELSIESGLVTPSEVATARQALEDGTLNIWRQRAERDVECGK
jgi:hypothetical protein